MLNQARAWLPIVDGLLERVEYKACVRRERLNHTSRQYDARTHR
ncbi:hypothetical protein SALB1_0892 [Salinisphaera sp. LB1]|nr:hypothetical protein SALB1_0892 [Salinisphaera sp. LB1]